MFILIFNKFNFISLFCSKDWFVLWVIGFLVYLICFFGIMLNISVWLNFRKLNKDVKLYVFVNFV